MAIRRMFSLNVVDTDKFLEMPVSSQTLYFHLGMRADDEGFVSSPKKIAMVCNCSVDDLKILASKGYIIPFEDGVIVITHWTENNQVRKDRFHDTKYQTEKKSLILSDGMYCLSPLEDDGNQMATEVRLGKDRLGKDNINTMCKDDLAKASKSKQMPANASQSKIKKEAAALFERLWEAYPNKKGKGQVSDTKKKKILKIGEAHMMRAIERYKQDLARDEWRKPQNGSTFFNSGYIDYLDDNYTPPDPDQERRKPAAVNSFNNYQQRDYDYDDLERRLIEEQRKRGD